MLRAGWLIAVLAGVAACAGDSPPPSGQCIGALFEPCNEEHDCDSLLCQNFIADEIQVCSQACDADTPCPDGATCDELTAACKPAAAIECTLP